jgi:recombination protein RecA
MRKLTAIIGKSRTLLIFINQIRMKIGVMFGNPETTTGGNALKFYASLRLDVRKTETIEGGKDADALGNRIRVKVVKNKVAPPFRKAEMDIMFGKGISAIGGLLDAAVKYEIIDKKGAWFAYNEDKIGQGRENVKVYLEQNLNIAREIEAKLRKIMFPGREFAETTAAPAKTVSPVPDTPVAFPVADPVASPVADPVAVSTPQATVPELEGLKQGIAAEKSSANGSEEEAVKRPVGRPRKAPLAEAVADSAGTRDALFS